MTFPVLLLKLKKVSKLILSMFLIFHLEAFCYNFTFAYTKQTNGPMENYFMVKPLPWRLLNAKHFQKPSLHLMLKFCTINDGNQFLSQRHVQIRSQMSHCHQPCFCETAWVSYTFKYVLNKSSYNTIHCAQCLTIKCQ